MGKSEKPNIEELVDIEEALDLIIDGYTYRQMANHFGVKSVSQLHKYLNRKEHSARTRDAFRSSAAIYAETAREVLESVNVDGTQIEMSKARELAQYYKWLSAKRDPQSFGEKIDISSLGEKIERNLPPWMKANESES